MKRRALLLILTASLAFAARARADEFLLAFTGFDYQDPNSNPATYLDIGEGYKVVGFVSDPVGPLLDPWVDFSVNEYTVYIRDLTVSSRAAFGPFLSVNFANNGRGSYYADDLVSGTHGTYGTFPPNATAPSTGRSGSRATSTISC